MSNENDSSGISTETSAFLEDVKKGKPRRFAMICKGTHIISLVLYKKGSLEKYKKEAKAQGKGEFYFGVVGGKGMDLVFQLASSDGFDGAPVKDTVLKKYLEESEFKCKPTFAIVESLPVIPDDEASTTPDLTAWKSKRALVIENLRQLAKVIADLKDPDSNAAIIEIKAVIANLLNHQQPHHKLRTSFVIWIKTKWSWTCATWPLIFVKT